MAAVAGLEPSIPRSRQHRTSLIRCSIHIASLNLWTFDKIFKLKTDLKQSKQMQKKYKAFPIKAKAKDLKKLFKNMAWLFHCAVQLIQHCRGSRHDALRQRRDRGHPVRLLLQRSADDSWRRQSRFNSTTRKSPFLTLLSTKDQSGPSKDEHEHFTEPLKQKATFKSTKNAKKRIF